MTTDTKRLIEEAVNRFLSWELPRDFAPDCGISFDGRKPDKWNPHKTWPVGTNLFTADQAKVMFEYAIATALEAAEKDAERNRRERDEALDDLLVFKSLAKSASEEHAEFFDRLTAENAALKAAEGRNDKLVSACKEIYKCAHRTDLPDIADDGGNDWKGEYKAGAWTRFVNALKDACGGRIVE